jgi:uncharacterized RDD family membrane protein YckC
MGPAPVSDDPRVSSTSAAAGPPPPSTGAADRAASPAVVVVPPVAPYAGFWRRFVAVVIDGLILTFFMFPINLMLRVPIFGILNQDEPSFDDILTLMRVSMASVAIGTLINWIYSATLESSKLQATLGKMALNIKVTDLEGRRISFARATGRFFGKLLSKLILFIGYLVQPFTARRQALHDMLAGTLVVRRGAAE